MGFGKLFHMKSFHIACVIVVSLIVAFIFSGLTGDSADNIMREYNSYVKYGGGGTNI